MPPTQLISIFHGGIWVSRYTLEVIAPQVEDDLPGALEAIALIYGGAVVDSCEVSTRKLQRRFVNIADRESSLEGELEWLRGKFPRSRFMPKELM